MESKQNEWKTALLKEMEAELDGLMKWDESKGRVLTVHEMEEQLLEVRQRLGERLMQRLLEYQSGKHKEEAPVSEVNGKRLQNKGKKTIGS